MEHQNVLIMSDSQTAREVDQETELSHIEARIERIMRHAWYETALEYERIRDNDIYKQHGWQTWAEYCRDRWNRAVNSIDEQIARARDMRQIVEISTITTEQIPASMSHVTALAKLEDPRHRAEVWQRVLASGQNITAKLVAAEVERKQAELNKSWFTLAEWMDLDGETRQRALAGWPSGKKFNETNENIQWAAWSWNPVTGCRFGCDYCYARDIANRFYPQKFEPSFHPDRLDAPQNMTVPIPRWDGDRGHKGVFVSSMGDLFGDWVPQEWIDAVLASVRNAPQWVFIFLTKNPRRLVGIPFPANAAVGATVDIQARVKPTEDAFEQVDARYLFVSCEPMREQLTFSRIQLFDWVIIGGQSKSTQTDAFQPPWEWVNHLHAQIENAGREVMEYWKPNLESRPREYPEW